MAISDSLGLPVSGASNAALEFYETALHQLQCFIGDPVASVNASIEASPDFVMAHVLKGYLFGLATEKEALLVARECHEAAAQLPATARERAHVEALGRLSHGRWHDAGRLLEDLSIELPRDALALQAGHQIDFFTGNSRMCGTALPA